jgi:hypothetical protein
MTAIRTKPEIRKVAADDSRSWIWYLFHIVIFLLIFRILSGTATVLEKNLCFGFAIVFSLLLFRNEFRENQQKEKWRAACTVAWLPILDRHSRSGGSYEDEYGIVHSSRSSYYLELEMNSDQRIVTPNEKVVKVDVGGSIYNSLLGRETVCVYYQPNAPLAFLIAEEF